MSYAKAIQDPQSFDFSIPTLGPCLLDSPMSACHLPTHPVSCGFLTPEDRVVLAREQGTVLRHMKEFGATPTLEKAGPHQQVFHDPAWVRAAIVTAGGLCPGLNNVIKGLVQVLWFDYGVRTIYGLRYGFQGLVSGAHHPPILLDPTLVDGIHEMGGTILGSSRGPQDVGKMVDTLARMNINLFFAVGGDGTLRGAHAIAEEIARRGLKISVVGVPKTIDNDLEFTDRTFGFETAVYKTFEVISSAHMEAKGAQNGIGLVKLMGRDSGFIAAHASLASSVVNLCLIPEAPFEMEGERGLLTAIARRWEMGKDHMVIVVAEGAGQELIAGDDRRDASGNLLKKDIGEFLKSRIESHFRALGKEVNVKYFDPSYSIRSAPAQGTDAILCYQLAENAVHAAMAGRTDCVVGGWNDQFVLIPIALATMQRKKVDVDGPLWRAVLGSTRQNDYYAPRK